MLISRKILDVLAGIEGVTNEDLDHQLSCYGGLEVEGITPVIPPNNYVVGEVISAEKHPDADKLQVCNVLIGPQTLQIVCGAPNVAPGKFVIVAVVGTILPGGMEIQSRDVRGITSTGMLCSLQEIGLEEKFVDSRYKEGIYLFEDGAVEAGMCAITALGWEKDVFDLSITPNRADCLSYRGVANEVAALFNNKTDNSLFNRPIIKGTFEGREVISEIAIDCQEVHSYTIRIFKDLKIMPAPLWMQSFLIATGVRPINNVVDITNYVMLFLGLPLHAFDANKLADDKMVVRFAKPSEQIITLDGKKRELSAEDIVIATRTTPIAIAGIMGGASTQVDDQTTSIILEAAIFNASHIRKTATRCNLRSDASARFEKGVDLLLPEMALNMATELLIKYASATASMQTMIAKEVVYEPKTIMFTHDQLVNKIGVDLTTDEVVTILGRLNFTINQAGENYEVIGPSYRIDLHIFEDVAEEVARLYGFDNIPNKLPLDVGRPVFVTAKRVIVDKMHQKLQGQGLQEILSYTLASKTRATLGTYKNKLEPLEILYPLNNERTTLKVTTYQSIIDVLQYHRNRFFSGSRFYEITDLYGALQSKTVLAFGAYGVIEDLPLHDVKITVDYFSLKGIVEQITADVATMISYQKTEHPLFHPNLAADVYFGSCYLGTFGKIHPIRAKALDVSEDFYLGEVSLAEIITSLTETNKHKTAYEQISKLPTIERDLAFVIERSIPAQTLVTSITEVAGPDCQEVIIFDVYEGKNIEQTEKSISIKFRFNNRNKTLTNEAVDKMVMEILVHVRQTCGAIVRGIKYENEEG
ncbi:MAG: phenylalanine--tRNA ligase subunit beta [Culicoidibacterales bacterium]